VARVSVTEIEKIDIVATKPSSAFSRWPVL
jgi:hypothetical protein